MEAESRAGSGSAAQSAVGFSPYIESVVITFISVDLEIHGPQKTNSK